MVIACEDCAFLFVSFVSEFTGTLLFKLYNNSQASQLIYPFTNFLICRVLNPLQPIIEPTSMNLILAGLDPFVCFQDYPVLDEVFIKSSILVLVNVD